MNTKELARQLLESELSQFDFSPLDYILSLGWDKQKFKTINKLRGKLSFKNEDIDNCNSIIKSIVRNSQNNNSELTIEIMQSNSISDFLSNFVASKILNEYKNN